MQSARDLFSHCNYWAHRLGPAPFLPTSRAEMDEFGWDSCDVIVVTGDAYVDHPSFGMAIVGRGRDLSRTDGRRETGRPATTQERVYGLPIWYAP